MASRRLRQRQAARPWQQPTPEPAIPWDQIAQDLAKREQQPVQQKGPTP
jgi:hypothetical protein